MKRKRVLCDELKTLRGQIELRYRQDGGTELEWKSYLPRYDDLNNRIQELIHGNHEAAISPNILRRLYWDTRSDDQATFNIVYLNAFARYITNGAQDYRAYRITPGDADAPAQSATALANGPTAAPAGQIPGGHRSEEGDEALQVTLSSDQEVNKGTNTGGTPLRMAAHLPLRSSMSPFIAAGLISGLLTFLFVLAFNDLSGYDWPGRQGLGEVMTSYFGSMVFGMLGLSLAIGSYAWILVRSTGPRNFFRWFHATLPLLFLSAFITRQLFVGNGWLVRGAGADGPLGKPDFESVAISLAICLHIRLMLGTFARGPVASMSARFLRATFISLACGTVFFTISTTYNILVSTGNIDPAGYQLDPRFFSFRFPHPERLPLICFMVFAHGYFTLRSFGELFTRGCHASSGSGSLAATLEVPINPRAPRS